MSVSQARGKRIFMSVFLALAGATMLAGIAVWVPTTVDAVGFLTGAEPQGTFIPVSYSQHCGKGGCHTMTDGYIQQTGERLTWPDKVSLGKPFLIRVPVMTGEAFGVQTDTGKAIADLSVSLVLEVSGLVMGPFFLWCAWLWWRDKDGETQDGPSRQSPLQDDGSSAPAFWPFGDD
jgi:hypothetical protein